MLTSPLVAKQRGAGGEYMIQDFLVWGGDDLSLSPVIRFAHFRIRFFMAFESELSTPVKTLPCPPYVGQGLS